MVFDSQSINSADIILDYPSSSEGIYGADFNGIYKFDNYTLGSNPWSGAGGTGQIVHSLYGHSYVYKIDNGARGIPVSNDMSTDWKIESYVNIEYLQQVGSGFAIIHLRDADNVNFLHLGYDKNQGGWIRHSYGTDGIIFKWDENWSSNSWMYWRIEFTASTDTYKYFINNTLVHTLTYSGITSLTYIGFDTGSWGDAGEIRIDSLCYSWHPEYYTDMIFDKIVDGIEFNGIETFAQNADGSNPWNQNSAGTGSIIASKGGHLKVYELDYASRRKYLTNDMTSDWTIEFYIMLENLGPGTGASVITLVGNTGQWIRYGYVQGDGHWLMDYLGSGGHTNIQSEEQWSSNTWMHWKITWDAAGDNFAFYVNNTLLNTHHYTALGSLAWIDIDAYSWGDPGKVWFDSFSWSWHPSYYEGMIFDPIDSNDGDPNDNGFVTFLILIIIAGMISICGIVIAKNQSKQRLI